jgi:hypothetical protein
MRRAVQADREAVVREAAAKDLLTDEQTSVFRRAGWLGEE